LHAAAAAATLTIWSLSTSWQAYHYLKPLLAGIDKLVWGLAFFVAAALISLSKSTRLRRWLEARRETLVE
jgi:hypothetical protein